MGLRKTLRRILNHPLNRGARTAALARYAKWQLGSRLSPGPKIIPFVNDSVLVMERGMTGATQNLYTGLQEFEDMSFLLHLLRQGDVFFDIGANVGVYTVLASAVCGARTVAFEPIPSALQKLQRNLAANHIAELVDLRAIGLSDRPGELRFTLDRDTKNRVLDNPNNDSEANDNSKPHTAVIPVTTLDLSAEGLAPTLIKIDVEDWELHVLNGATDTLARPSLLGLIVELNTIQPGLADPVLDSGEQAVDRLLRSSGFISFAYDPFSRALTPASPKQPGHENTLYLRDLPAARARITAAPKFRVLQHQI